jgi:hypothetical protein
MGNKNWGGSPEAFLISRICKPEPSVTIGLKNPADFAALARKTTAQFS